MKKGQLAGQPFVYIFAIVVIGLIVVYGAYVIIELISVRDTVETNLFLNNLKKEVDSCYNLDFGSTCGLNDLVVPSEFKEICFVNTGEFIDFDVIEDEFTKELVEISVENENYNVFLVPVLGKELDKRRYFVNKLRSNENPLCVNVIGSRIKLKLENRGNYIEILRA